MNWLKPSLCPLLLPLSSSLLLFVLLHSLLPPLICFSSFTTINWMSSGPPAKKIKVSLFNEEGDSSSSSSSSSATSNPPTKVVNDFIIEEKNVCKVKECVEKGIAGKSCPHMTIRQMYAFDHDKKTGAFSVSGRVTKNCVLEPESLEDYGLMMKAMARDAEINRSKRSTKTLVAESNLLTGTNGEMVFIPPVHANKEKVEKDRSENDIKKDLLTALGDNERMTMKELCGFCKCKDSDLKPLLDKFCYYHKKGQYVKFYELKQEFKNYAR